MLQQVFLCRSQPVRPPQAFTFVDRPCAGPARTSQAPALKRNAPRLASPTANFARQDPGQVGLCQNFTSVGQPLIFLLARLGQVQASRGGQASAAPCALGGKRQSWLTNPLLTLAPARAQQVCWGIPVWSEEGTSPQRANGAKTWRRGMLVPYGMIWRCFKKLNDVLRYALRRPLFFGRRSGAKQVLK